MEKDLFNTISDTIAYKLPNAKKEKKYTGTVGFWFKKPTTITDSHKYIIYSLIGSIEDEQARIWLEKSRDGKLSVNFSMGISLGKHAFDFLYDENDWHFIMWSYAYDVEKDKQTNLFFFDGKYILDNQKLVAIVYHDNVTHKIGTNLNGYYTGIMISSETFYDFNAMNTYYQNSRYYLLNKGLKVDEAYSNTSTSYFNEYEINDGSVNKKYEIYPLNNMLESLDGKKPLMVDLGENIVLTQNKLFKYNDDVNHLVYQANGHRIVYDFSHQDLGNNASPGTIALRFNLFDIKLLEERCIIELVNKGNKEESLFKISVVDTTLQITVNGTIVNGVEKENSFEKIEKGKWYNLAISYNSSNVAVYLVNENNEKVTKEYELNKEIDSSLTVIGIDYNKNYPLYGEIEKLMTIDIKIEDNQLPFNDSISSISSTSKYDNMDLLVERKVVDKNKDVLTSHYDYLPYSNDYVTNTDNDVDQRYRMTSLIKKETIKFSDNIREINYTYDPLGFITEYIEKEGNEVIEHIKYTYDEYGRLSAEANMTYGHAYIYFYDEKGNITTVKNSSVVEKTYTYDEIYLDKLVKFNDKTIKYDKTNLFPSEYGTYENEKLKDGYKYTFNKGKLIEVTKYENFVSTDIIKYEYEEKNLSTLGKRTKKNVNGIITSYEYLGDLLIKEEKKYLNGDTEQKEYYYNESNELIKIIYEDKETKKEIYVIRDIYSNIKYLMEDGKIVLSYRYDAYGKVLRKEGSYQEEGYGDINPFIYKGYYYDTETKLYYCESRYYNPEWGRWISPDDLDYLDPESINGLNLYCYCDNNPVMYVDPSGHMPEWLQDTLKILGAVGTVIGVTALTVVTVGVAAYALCASTAMIGAVTAGAAVGGLVAGGLEIGAQIYENGIDGMNLGAIAIESFAGSAYGAISGVASTTTSAALRLGMRGARVALGGISKALHGINNGDSFGTIMLNVGVSIGTGILIQGAFTGLDAYTGKLSSAILQSYALDGALTLGINQLLLISGILFGKSVWKNRGLFI